MAVAMPLRYRLPRRDGHRRQTVSRIGREWCLPSRTLLFPQHSRRQKIMLRIIFFGMVVALVMIVAPIDVKAQPMGAMSDSDYMAKVMTAAPAPVVKGATIVQMQKDGTMRTLQTG